MHETKQTPAVTRKEGFPVIPSSMGISGSNWWRYVNVPYVWPYFAGIFPEP
jgi:hypothetical protein